MGLSQSPFFIFYLLCKLYKVDFDLNQNGYIIALFPSLIIFYKKGYVYFLHKQISWYSIYIKVLVFNSVSEYTDH